MRIVPLPRHRLPREDPCRLARHVDIHAKILARMPARPSVSVWCRRRGMPALRLIYTGCVAVRYGVARHRNASGVKEHVVHSLISVFSLRYTNIFLTLFLSNHKSLELELNPVASGTSEGIHSRCIAQAPTNLQRVVQKNIEMSTNKSPTNRTSGN